MYNKNYIDYLNTLHNYNAQNQNAYGEKNVESLFYSSVMVSIGLSDFIVKLIETNDPHIIILTGHAGDGKTSLMYQVIKELGASFDVEAKISDIKLSSGNMCRCIKDFSELSDDTKLTTMKEIVNCPKNGDFVFMVANTGPLINTFGQLFEDKEESEKAKIELIDAIDRNSGEIMTIAGYTICIINVATVDNTYFATEFLEKILVENLWDKCIRCKKCQYCSIYKNRNLIIKNKQRVFEFINMHYIWLAEHGKRLTIRSMTEQLAYMITGGLSCEEVKLEEPYKYLFPNLFMGYIGTRVNVRAKSVLAIYDAFSCRYDKKRLRSDELYLVKKDYNSIFGKEVADILKMAEEKNAYVDGWTELVRRVYLFLNIVTDEDVINNDTEDVFSKHFRRYLELRTGRSTPSKSDVSLIVDALSMIYIGTTNSEQEIPLTLSRESGIAQNVQLITGTVPIRKMSIVQKCTRDSSFNSGKIRYSIGLKIDKSILDCDLTLPMLDYFEELKNGIIATNIDPQLSHGLESLKAQLSQKMDDVDDDSIEMIVLKNIGNELVRLEIDNNGKIRRI